jgi:hypothetical protein
MNSPPNKKRAPAKSALQNLEVLAAYHAVAFFAKTFERPFWFFEQRRARLADRLEYERAKS